MTSTASPEARKTDNDAALHAIRDHHEALVRDLAATVDDVLDAVRAGADRPPRSGLGCATWQARDALITLLTDDLLPHAAAEEQAIYPAAARDPRTRALVRAMLDEHRVLTDRAASLRTVTDPVSLVALAAELNALFEVHVSKENHHLLPALVDQGADLRALLADTHHLISHPAKPPTDPPTAHHHHRGER